MLMFGGMGGAPATAESPAPPTSVRVVAVGDIASCTTNADEEVGALARRLEPAALLTLGDHAYPNGSPEEFASCYDAGWGALRNRTYPAPGNHDYGTPAATGYFSYFGRRAPAPYYSFDVGGWHVVSLNTEVDHAAGSAQERWLRRDLRRSKARCELLSMHRPRWAGGARGHGPSTDALWRAAYHHGVDLVLAGHEHNYQRFFRLDGHGRRDPRYGIRQIVVGTGGAALYDVGRAEYRAAANGTTYGLLHLTLRPRGYRAEFVPVNAAGFRDAPPAEACHGARPRR